MEHIRSRDEQRMKRKKRIAVSIRGTSFRPRLAVFRSNRYLTAQLIDDDKRETLAEARVGGKTMEHAKKLGADIAKIAAEKKITSVVFDRAGFRYHGAIAAVASAAREGGLQF